MIVCTNFTFINKIYMKPVTKKRVTFIAKSMLWSALLYVVLMLGINWDDLYNRVKGTNAITVIRILPSQQSTPEASPVSIPANIAHSVSTVEKITTITKALIHAVGIATR